MSGGSGSPQVRYVNGYIERGQLVLVRHTRSGIKIDRRRAEYSCFIKTEDLTRTIRRELERTPAAVGMANEGPWTRLLWADRDTCHLGAKWLENEVGVQTYEAGVHPVRRFMVDTGARIQKPRRCYMDIETDSRLPFSRKEEMRILCYSVVDAQTGEIHHRLLKKDTDRSERRLLIDFWNTLTQFDQVLAWNGNRFDFPVLRARLERQGMAGDWRQILWLDHLDLFRRMNMMAAETGEEKQSFALGYIAQAVLGEGKVDFDASRTWEAWANAKRCRNLQCMKCRACLLKYCDWDTVLMRKVEEKTGYVQLFDTLCEVCNIFGDSYGLNPSVQVESSMLRLAKEEGHHFKSRLKIGGEGQFEGAFVLHPTDKGILKNVHVADFASLYPSIIRSWNMSPETRVGARGPTKTNSWSPLTQIAFTTKTEGLMPKAMRIGVEMRQVWKERQKKAKPGTAKAKEAERRTTAYKIFNNIFFGVAGSPTSMIFDRETARSITQCGAWLIQNTIKAANDRGMRVIYGDTDSLFVIGCTKDEFKRFVAWCNEKLYPKLLASVGCKMNCIELDYEKEFERVVFTTAKRYLGWFAHYKGSPPEKDSKPEVKGLEFKRGDSIRFARALQERVTLMLTRERVEDPKAIEPVLNEWRDRILHGALELDDVVISKRLSRPLDAYAVRYKKNGEPAAQLPHIEIAKRMRDLGHDVGEGAKIDYYVADGSTSPKYCRPAYEWDGGCDRFELWDALVAPPTLRVLEAAFPGHDWKPWRRSRPAKSRGRKAKSAGKN